MRFLRTNQDAEVSAVKQKLEYIAKKLKESGLSQEMREMFLRESAALYRDHVDDISNPESPNYDPSDPDFDPNWLDDNEEE